LTTDEEDFTLRRQTTQESVADTIRRLILSGQLQPGQRILQEEFAQKLGVSNTPLREALHKLQSEGLVTLSAHRGATVTNFSISDLQEIYQVRIALEGYAAYLAAQLITEEEINTLEAILSSMEPVLKKGDKPRLLELNRSFHMGIFKASRQPRLCDLISNYIDLAGVYRRILVNLEPAEMVKHSEILVTLCNHDSVAAELVTRKHLQKTLTDLMAFLKAHPQ
jgi:DNA-binding GntR family transcriptional regulator